MRAIWLLLLSACTLSVPPAPGAQETCVEWMQACRDKELACGHDQAQASATYEKAVMETCSKVIWSDIDQVRNVCIPAVLDAACEDAKDVHCGGYAHL